MISQVIFLHNLFIFTWYVFASYFPSFNFPSIFFPHTYSMLLFSHMNDLFSRDRFHAIFFFVQLINFHSNCFVTWLYFSRYFSSTINFYSHEFIFLIVSHMHSPFPMRLQIVYVISRVYASSWNLAIITSFLCLKCTFPVLWNAYNHKSY